MSNELRLIASEAPPWFISSCIPNGTNLVNFTALCPIPGVEALFLRYILLRAGLKGVFYTAETDAGVENTLSDGSFDMSGYSFAKSYYENFMKNDTLMTMPFGKFGAMFVAPLEQAHIQTVLSPLRMFSPSLWLLLAALGSLCLLLEWALNGMDYKTVKCLSLFGAWVLTILGGVYSDTLAVQLSQPFDSKAPFNNTAELAEKLLQKRCKWYTSDFFMGSAPGLFTKTGSVPSIDKPKDVALRRKFQKIAEINPVVNTGSVVQPLDSLKLLLMKKKTEKHICHVIVDWHIIPSVYLRMSKVLDFPLVIVADTRLSVYEYGFVMSKTVPRLTQEKIQTSITSFGISSLYHTLATRYSEKHKFDSKEDKPTAAVNFFQNRILRMGNLYKLFDVILLGTVAAAIMLLSEFLFKWLKLCDMFGCW